MYVLNCLKVSTSWIKQLKVNLYVLTCSNKNDAANIISDEAKGINSNCRHLKSIWSESDNGFNMINVWQIKYETKLHLIFSAIYTDKGI